MGETGPLARGGIGVALRSPRAFNRVYQSRRLFLDGDGDAENGIETGLTLGKKSIF